MSGKDGLDKIEQVIKILAGLVALILAVIGLVTTLNTYGVFDSLDRNNVRVDSTPSENPVSPDTQDQPLERSPEIPDKNIAEPSSPSEISGKEVTPRLVLAHGSMYVLMIVSALLTPIIAFYPGNKLATLPLYWAVNFVIFAIIIRISRANNLSGFSDLFPAYSVVAAVLLFSAVSIKSEWF